MSFSFPYNSEPNTRNLEAATICLPIQEVNIESMNLERFLKMTSEIWQGYSLGNIKYAISEEYKALPLWIWGGKHSYE
jgi:hypothetical protein